MKKWLSKTVEFIRLAVVILLILALSFDGAASAGRLFSNCDEIDQPDKDKLETPLLQQGPPSPEELPGNMETGGKPYTEQPAYLQAALFIKADNSDKRFQVIYEKINNPISYDTRECNKSSIINNSNLVCSSLGHQFTLVGAKPSGTS